MKLTIEIAENRLIIDGQPIRGRHRWEAAALAALIQGKHVSPTSACGAPKLHAALEALGQPRPLNRKQVSRVWDGVGEMFESAGKGQALAERLGHPARGRTVGPWWWAAPASDRVRVPGAKARSSGHLELPRLVVDATPEQCAALCQHVMVCEGLLIDGNVAEVIGKLNDDDVWRPAAPEFRVFRCLRLAECHLQRRDFENALDAIAAARAMLAGCEAASVYLGGAVRLMQHRLAYMKAPTKAYPKISSALVPMLGQAAGTRFAEVDRFTRGLALNLAALCERRWLEQHAKRKGAEASAPHLEAALRYWYAALFGFITSNQYELAQNMCSNIGYLLQRAFELGLHATPQPALEWYAVAQIWQNRFDLADNNVWEYIFLGDFWLYQPSVRPAFKAMASRVGWGGRRPDRLDFYEHAFKRAREIGEPRQTASTALNLWHFAREHGQASIATAARSALRHTLAAHPDVRAILAAEGYPLP